MLAGLLILASLLPPGGITLHADAFLSEDKVHYGADTYTLDYEKQVIDAKGHAFFRKGDRSVFADRILIHYAQGQKRAHFYGNVVLENRVREYRISGEQAEAHFGQETYLIEGNALYIDPARTIRSFSILELGDDLEFSGRVRYDDGAYTVAAPKLRAREDTARFEGGVEAVETAKGDRIACRSLTYYTGTGDLLFQGEVLYEQSRDGKGLVLTADSIRFVRATDTFYLVGNTYVLQGELSLSSSVMEYGRERGVVTAMGDALLKDGSKAVSSGRIGINVDTQELIMYEEASGVFSTRGR